MKGGYVLAHIDKFTKGQIGELQDILKDTKKRMGNTLSLEIKK